MPFERDLEEMLGVKIELANDANCFALAEAHWGIVKEQRPTAKMIFELSWEPVWVVVSYTREKFGMDFTA
jgi:hypothetical protein